MPKEHYKTLRPDLSTPAGSAPWHAPNLQEAERLIAASHTRGTPVTIWEIGGQGPNEDYTNVQPYLVSLLDRLGYPTRVKNLQSDPNAPLRFADSRTRAQAALIETNPWYPSPTQIIQTNFACQSFKPDSTANANLSEFCNHQLDAQIAQALSAESNNSPDTAALWARADRTLTDQAPIVALTVSSNIDFVSARVGNYTRSLQAQDVFPDQFWVR
jgi:peptide/nickel transport system substrate-binding protein